MQELEEDYYAILEIEETASVEDVRKAYIRLAKKLHPDRFPNDAKQRAEAQEQFAKVTRAHEVISDPDRRSEYDTLRTLVRERQQAQLANPNVDVFVSPVTTIGSSSQRAAYEVGSNIKWAEKHLTRADELLKSGRINDAETAIKEALRLMPTDPRCHVLMAEIYLARNWRTLALTEVQAALRADPKNKDAKSLEIKIKMQSKPTEGKPGSKGQQEAGGSGKKGLFDQIKELLNKKI